MASPLVEFAARNSACERRLILAESDRHRIGDALAVLFEDPTDASPAWTAAVTSYSRIWAGYKSFEPIMAITDLLEHVVQSLRGDPQLIAAVACWTGRELLAWALPGALVLARNREQAYVLEDDGFRAVTSQDNLLRAGTPASSAVAHGRLSLAGGDQFVLMPRVLGARTGLWRFEHALAKGDPAAALTELAPDNLQDSLIIGRLDPELARTTATAELAAGEALPDLASEPPRPLDEPRPEPAIGGAADEPLPVSTAAATDDTKRKLVFGAGGPSDAHHGTSNGDHQPLAAAGAGPSAAEHAIEVPGGTETMAATAPEAVATAASASGQSGDELDSGGSEADGGPKIVSASQDSDLPRRGGIYLRERRARRGTATAQGTLFGRQGSQADTAADQTARPLVNESAFSPRIRSRRSDPRSSSIFLRGLTWLGLGTTVVVLLAAIILISRFLTSSAPEGDLVDGASLRPVATHDVESAETAAPTGGVPAPPGFEGATWTRSFDQGVSSSPIIHGDQVIFGCRDGRVYALRLRDGSEVWSAALGAGIGSSPVIEGRRVFIGTYAGAVVALDVENGAELWRHPTGARIVSTAAITSGGIVAIGSHDNNVYGLSAADGSLQWKTATGGVVWASPAIGPGDRVIVGSHDGKVYCIHGTDGRVLWQAPTGGKIYSSAAIQGDRVAVGSSDGKVYCLSLEDGKPLWTYEAGAEVGGSVTADAAGFIVGTDAGDLLCLDPVAGGRRWAVRTGAAIKSQPRVQEGRVWVTGYDTLLHVVDAGTGTELWTFDADAKLFSSPAPIGRTAFFGSLNGTFYAATWPLSSAEASP